VSSIITCNVECEAVEKNVKYNLALRPILSKAGNLKKKITIFPEKNKISRLLF